LLKMASQLDIHCNFRLVFSKKIQWVVGCDDAKR